MPRDIPALVMGILLACYWARVIHLVHKTRRQSGKSANFLPPEPLGRAVRSLWYPVVALWIALPLLAAGHRHMPLLLRPIFLSPALAWSAVGVAILAFIATLICWKKMGKSWRMGIDPSDKTQLVVSGPYAYVRHPIYALSSILMLCTMVVLPSPAMWLVGLLHLTFLQWEARREEKYLLQLHGREYGQYAGRTGRFFPRWPSGRSTDLQ